MSGLIEKKLDVFLFFSWLPKNGELYSGPAETQYFFWSAASPPLFNYERSCKVPYPDLTCFGEFNKPLW